MLVKVSPPDELFDPTVNDFSHYIWRNKHRCAGATVEAVVSRAATIGVDVPFTVRSLRKCDCPYLKPDNPCYRSGNRLDEVNLIQARDLAAIGSSD
jgi:hypothetical protein